MWKLFLYFISYLYLHSYGFCAWKVFIWCIEYLYIHFTFWNKNLHKKIFKCEKCLSQSIYIFPGIFPLFVCEKYCILLYFVVYTFMREFPSVSHKNCNFNEYIIYKNGYHLKEKPMKSEQKRISFTQWFCVYKGF